ncbi:MAG TPA: hypothetical protein VN843_32805, partial [Anaerolineales bacterium]|nr:hypothetical protein [Anaerolineales bacterium]
MIKTSKESYFESLEAVTKSLEKERLFLDALSHTKASFITANKILVLIGFFPEFSLRILFYLKDKNSQLFHYQSKKAMIVLSDLLEEITRNANLSVYLALKGVFPQALSVLRVCVELIGIYTHVWKEPQKMKYVWNSDSDGHAKSFRYTEDKEINKELKRRGVKYRFAYCHYAGAFSELYQHLSGEYVHSTKSNMRIQSKRNIKLSCYFVDRFHPK